MEKFTQVRQFPHPSSSLWSFLFTAVVFCVHYPLGKTYFVHGPLNCEVFLLHSSTVGSVSISCSMCLVANAAIHFTNRCEQHFLKLVSKNKRNGN